MPRQEGKKKQHPHRNSSLNFLLQTTYFWFDSCLCLCLSPLSLFFLEFSTISFACFFFFVFAVFVFFPRSVVLKTSSHSPAKPNRSALVAVGSISTAVRCNKTIFIIIIIIKILIGNRRKREKLGQEVKVEYNLKTKNKIKK